MIPYAIMAYMDSETVREVRLALGKTQQEIASALGVSLRQWTRWEGGATPAPADLRERLESLSSGKDVNLAEIPSTRLVKELMSRARQWDLAKAERESFNHSGNFLRAVASPLEDLPEEDDDDKI